MGRNLILSDWPFESNSAVHIVFPLATSRSIIMRSRCSIQCNGSQNMLILICLVSLDENWFRTYSHETRIFLKSKRKEIGDSIIPCSIPYMMHTMSDPKQNVMGNRPLEKPGIKIIVNEVGTLEDKVSRIIKMGEEERRINENGFNDSEYDGGD